MNKDTFQIAIICLSSWCLILVFINLTLFFVRGDISKGINEVQGRIAVANQRATDLHSKRGELVIWIERNKSTIQELEKRPQEINREIDNLNNQKPELIKEIDLWKTKIDKVKAEWAYHYWGTKEIEGKFPSEEELKRGRYIQSYSRAAYRSRTYPEPPIFGE